jgi:hypothetical protein
MAMHAQLSISVSDTRCILFFEFTANLPSMINSMHAYFLAKWWGRVY